MNLTRMIARRTGNIPWWVFSPTALIAVVVVLLAVAMLGAVSSPATGAAAEAEARAAACTITTTQTSQTSGTASVGAGGPGLTPGTSTVVLDATQMLNAQTIAAAGKAAAAPIGAVAVALAVSFVDTGLSATADVGGGIATGLFLQTAGDYPGVNRADPAAAAAAFYARLLALPAYISGQSLGVIAHTMQHTDAGVDAYLARADWATTLATTLTTGTGAAGSGAAGENGGSAGDPAVVCTGGAGDGTVFDPGNIISDRVFYDATAMTAGQIGEFLAEHGTGCADSNPWCVKNLRLTAPARAADAYCAAYPGGTDQDVATFLAAISTACGVNPQVMLTTLQRESQGLTRANPGPSSWDSAWGWGCPDTGPGGTANCAATDRGFANQAWQMAHQWARYRVEIPNGRYNFRVGTYNILWNVAEIGCGGSDVTIQNIATASLYVYTPYQPNAASIATYPGEGDRCSSYGNRNFFYLFRSYFGSTGGGKAAPGSAGGPIQVDGPVITLPAAAGVAGTVTAPNPAVATVIAAGLGWLGTDYSWGGGGPAGPTTGICTGGVAFDACHTVGFDCSGLTLYVWAQVGINLPRYSQDQLKTGPLIPYSQAVAGDLIGYPGHVAMFLGTINGVDYMLEAPYTGSFVRVAPVRNGHYGNVTRVWAGLS
jgi:cell wall-associated NlpC family hydrolase